MKATDEIENLIAEAAQTQVSNLDLVQLPENTDRIARGVFKCTIETLRRFSDEDILKIVRSR